MKKILFLLVFSATLIGCDRSSQVDEQWRDASGILRFIPADSPLIGVRLVPFPAEFRDRFVAQNALIERANRDALQALLDNAGALDEAGGDSNAFRDTFRLLDELINAEADTGISPDAPAAFYWVGNQPVFRVALLDQAVFERFATEQLGALKTTPADLRGTRIRYIESQGPRLALLVDAGYAVLTLAPEGVDETELAAQLGLTLPSVDVAASGLLGEIAKTHELTGGQLVYLQPVGLFDVLTAPGGLQTQLLATMANVVGGLPLDGIPPECLSDLRRRYSSVEAITLGFSEAGATGLKGALAVDIEPSIAEDLENLARPVPGLGMPTDALLSFGFSLNAKTLRRFVENRVESILDEPFQCAALAGLNQQAVRTAAILDKQPTPPTARDFRGVVVSADWPEGAMQSGLDSWMNARIRWILASDKPESLVAFGNLVLPPLAALNLQPDGTIVEVPDGLLNPTGKQMVVAMTDDRLIGAVGPDGAKRLAVLKDLKPNKEAPLFAMSVDAAALLDLSGDLGVSPSYDSTLLSEMKALYARQSLQVRTTEHGIRIDFELGLKEESK